MVFMRSIKYRAFYKGEMRQVTALEWIHEGEDLAGCYLTGIDKCVIVNDDETTFGVDLLEFTGLHDRNGTEIYEGDIIKLDRTNCNEIGIKLHIDMVRRDKVGYYHVDDKRLHHCRLKKCEVVGNVFENPKLLNVDDHPPEG